MHKRHYLLALMMISIFLNACGNSESDTVGTENVPSKVRLEIPDDTAEGFWLGVVQKKFYWQASNQESIAAAHWDNVSISDIDLSVGGTLSFTGTTESGFILVEGETRVMPWDGEQVKEIVLSLRRNDYN